MNTFYNKMHLGDLVLIPSEGGKEVSIGVVGDLIDEIHHLENETEYPKCEYIHKRRVNWIKKVDLYQDVYLFRALRGQQTISDITDCAGLVLRNLYPVYISNNSLHLTLKKRRKQIIHYIRMFRCVRLLLLFLRRFLGYIMGKILRIR